MYVSQISYPDKIANRTVDVDRAVDVDIGRSFFPH